MTPLQERFLRQYYPEHAVEKLRGIAIKIHDFRFAGLGLKVAFGGQLYFWHDFRGAWAKVPPATADLIAEIKTPSLLLAEDLRRDIILRSRERTGSDPLQEPNTKSDGLTSDQEAYLRKYLPASAIHALKAIIDIFDDDVTIHDANCGADIRVEWRGAFYRWDDYNQLWLVADNCKPRCKRKLQERKIDPPATVTITPRRKPEPEPEPRIYLRQSDVQDIFDLLVMLREETQSRSVHERATRLVELLEPMLQICRGEIA